MKTKIIALIAPVLFLLTACDSTYVTPNSVSNTLKDGSWRVSFYWDVDHEETSNFDGYQFIFASNNIVTANDGNTDVTGTWYVADGDDSDDNTELVLYFELLPPFNELNASWNVLEKTATKVHMQSTSGGGGTAILTFQKL